MTGPAIPGARFAFRVIHPGSPMLRMRYRDGIAVGPHGFPDWIPYARMVVALPPSSPDLGVDEARVVDVLTASETAARAGDPLWAEVAAPATPAGWTWAHLALRREIALVPIELHGTYRHLGGVSTGTADRRRRGLPAEGGPPPLRYTERLGEEVLAAVEERLGVGLPAGYRAFLGSTNGGVPLRPAVHPAHGFLADQPFFGVARPDRLQDLVYANAWFSDRFTADFLAIGYVQGGLLAVRVRGGDEGSIWYWDDDDHRDREELGAHEVSERLLHRCADGFDGFWQGLCEIPAALHELAMSNAAGGHARPVHPDRLGVSLPPARRPPPPSGR